MDRTPNYHLKIRYDVFNEISNSIKTHTVKCTAYDLQQLANGRLAVTVTTRCNEHAQPMYVEHHINVINLYVLEINYSDEHFTRSASNFAQNSPTSSGLN